MYPCSISFLFYLRWILHEVSIHHYYVKLDVCMGILSWKGKVVGHCCYISFTSSVTYINIVSPHHLLLYMKRLLHIHHQAVLPYWRLVFIVGQWKAPIYPPYMTLSLLHYNTFCLDYTTLYFPILPYKHIKL